MVMTGHDFVLAAKSLIREVSAEEALALMARGAKVVDVREPEEFAAGHLPGALNIPRGVLEFKVAAVPELQDREPALLVYCKTGGRSALATRVLNQMGYGEAVSLAGGFDPWAQAGRPVVKPQPLNYD